MKVQGFLNVFLEIQKVAKELGGVQKSEGSRFPNFVSTNTKSNKRAGRVTKSEGSGFPKNDIKNNSVILIG